MLLFRFAHVLQITNLASRRRSDKHSRARAILAREFGRTSLPPKVARKWVVEVSPAEWDADENRWRYRILLQRRNTKYPPNSAAPVTNVHSFTTAFTWRCLADFIWLENALRAEFQGSLVLPLLSVAVGAADVAKVHCEVDASLLRDWLGDVMNGVRGQGELILHQESIDLMGSEALEAFLYRNTDSLPASAPTWNGDLGQSRETSVLDKPWRKSPEKEIQEASFVDSLLSKPFECLPIDSICVGDGPTQSAPSDQQGSARQVPLEMMNYQSRAIGDARTLQIQDSFVEYSEHLESSDIAVHLEVLEVQREVLTSYRHGCITTIEQLRRLSEDEALVGAAWKRFAVSLSNLFSYEKDIENSRVGEKKDRSTRSNALYKKLGKGVVDDLLRVLAKQKFERSMPSLACLETMLIAYAGDLSAVDPSVRAFVHAIKQMSCLSNPSLARSSTRRRPSESGWQSSLKAFFGFNDSKESSTQTGSFEPDDSQKQAYQERVATNERQLQAALTTLCRSVPIRGARMAYKYFHVEASQTALLSSAAISLRTKVNIADRSSVDELKERHIRESADDDRDETATVQKILDIGYTSKFSHPTEADQEEDRKNDVRERTLRLARERRGRWDSKLALTIMEVVGVHDAEVQVEETTRDLRLVRRHAIGLRENLSRCVEALSVLKSSIQRGNLENTMETPRIRDVSCDVIKRFLFFAANTPYKGTSSKPIRSSRLDFVAELSQVLSGNRPKPVKTGGSKGATPSSSILKRAGVSLEDPVGWVLTRGKVSYCRLFSEALLLLIDATSKRRVR